MTFRKLTVAALLIVGAVTIVVGLRVTGAEQQRIRERHIAAGYTVIPGDPSIGQPDMFVLPAKSK